MPFDTDLFITEVESHPALWDSRSADYSNRIEKRKAWEELCEKFIEDFGNKSSEEKNTECKYLIYLINILLN